MIKARVNAYMTEHADEKSAQVLACRKLKYPKEADTSGCKTMTKEMCTKLGLKLGSLQNDRIKLRPSESGQCLIDNGINTKCMTNLEFYCPFATTLFNPRDLLTSIMDNSTPIPMVNIPTTPSPCNTHGFSVVNYNKNMVGLNMCSCNQDFSDNQPSCQSSFIPFPCKCGFSLDMLLQP